MVHNHTIDHGRERLANIYRALRDVGIVPLGYGKTAEEQVSPVTIRKGKLEVALFNTIPLPIENRPRAEGKPDICHASVKRLASSIRNIKPFIPPPVSWPYCIGGRNSNPFPTCSSVTMPICWYSSDTIRTRGATS